MSLCRPIPLADYITSIAIDFFSITNVLTLSMAATPHSPPPQKSASSATASRRLWRLLRASCITLLRHTSEPSSIDIHPTILCYYIPNKEMACRSEHRCRCPGRHGASNKCQSTFGITIPLSSVGRGSTGYCRTRRTVWQDEYDRPY